MISKKDIETKQRNPTEWEKYACECENEINSARIVCVCVCVSVIEREGETRSERGCV